AGRLVCTQTSASRWVTGPSMGPAWIGSSCAAAEAARASRKRDRARRRMGRRDGVRSTEVQVKRDGRCYAPGARLLEPKKTPHPGCPGRRGYGGGTQQGSLFVLVFVDGHGADVPGQHLLDVGVVLVVLAVEDEAVVAQLGALLLRHAGPARAVGVVELVRERALDAAAGVVVAVRLRPRVEGGTAGAGARGAAGADAERGDVDDGPAL